MGNTIASQEEKAPITMTGAKMRMANKNPSVTYSVTFSREPALNSMTAPTHIRITAVPATRLVASPPFNLNKNINRISIRKAMGVRTARVLAVVEYCFFLSPFLPESLLHCLPAFQADPLFSDCSSDLHFFSVLPMSSG